MSELVTRHLSYVRVELIGDNVTGSHFSTNRAAGRHAEQQHRRVSCRRERLRLPSYTAGQTPTVHRYRKQVTAGRHVITACQSDTTSFSSPPDRYCLPTWRDFPHRLQILIALPLHRQDALSTSTASSQKMPQATLQRRRPDVARPPASNDGHRTGQHVTFHAFTR